MAKPRILITIHYMELGGAEISLIGMLQSIDYSKYDVDLFVWSHRGELMNYIPKEVHILPEIKEYGQIERPLKDVIKDGYYRIAYARLRAKLQFLRYTLSKHPKDGSAVFQFVADSVNPYLPNLRGEYDVAISYESPHNFVLSKVKSNKKIAWIHTDYSAIDISLERELPIWSAYDSIVSISEDSTKAFMEVFPSLSNRLVMIENILSSSFVWKRAHEIPYQSIICEMNCDSSVTKLLSVGRFCHAKNFDNIPSICRRIIELGCQVKWFIIGYGGDEKLIRRKIEEAHLEEIVIILGKKNNPYPYMNACDIYVQPSRYEGKSVAVREAQMLCKPVVISNYSTAGSQIKDGQDGIIVPQDNDGCAEGIVRFIMDPHLRNEISDYLKAHDFSNVSEIEKVEQLFC